MLPVDAVEQKLNHRYSVQLANWENSGVTFGEYNAPLAVLQFSVTCFHVDETVIVMCVSHYVDIRNHAVAHNRSLNSEQ